MFVILSVSISRFYELISAFGCQYCVHSLEVSVSPTIMDDLASILFRKNARIVSGEALLVE